MDNNFFEYIFCHNALTDNVYMSSVIDHYNQNYFENGDIKNILNIAVDFFQKRNVLPTLTEIRSYLKTPEEIEGFKRVLTEIKTLDKKYNYDELYQNTEKFLREKAVYNSIVTTAETMAKNKTIDTDNILNTFTQACNISLIDNIGLDYFEKIDDHCSELIKPNNTIDTGFRFLNKNIEGGWKADGRALYIFTGATNVGKSIFLGHVTIAGIKARKTVVLITLEMPEQMYAKRISSNISKLPLNTLPTYIDELKTKIIQFKDAYEGSRLLIKEFPTKQMSVNHLNSYINKIIKKGIKPDMIVVDYLNLIKAAKSYNGTYDEVKAIAENLRASTYLFEIPIISATQLNRKGFGKEDPGMEATSESIGLSFTADAQFSIWTTPEQKQQGIINIGIQKNRFGPNAGNVPVKIDYTTLTLEEFPEDTTIHGNEELGDAPNTLDISNALNKF